MLRGTPSACVGVICACMTIRMLLGKQHDAKMLQLALNVERRNIEFGDSHRSKVPIEIFFASYVNEEFA